MLKIRLARVGKKKKPTYRFVISEAGRDTFGPSLEIVGHYNPFSKVCEVNKDRILYWISKGAKPSPTVHNILVDQNVITGPKVRASKVGKKAENKEAAEALPAEKPAEVPKEAGVKPEAEPALPEAKVEPLTK
jgi:small subunit ribosomal protein S16